MKNITLTKEEFLSLCMLANIVAKQEGEDIIGVLTKFGAFRILNPEKLVKLASRIEKGNKDFDYDTR